MVKAAAGAKEVEKAEGGGREVQRLSLEMGGRAGSWRRWGGGKEEGAQGGGRVVEKAEGAGRGVVSSPATSQRAGRRGCGWQWAERSARCSIHHRQARRKSRQLLG